MKRFIPIAIALCMLVSMTLIPGVAHAQSRLDLESYHVAVVADGGGYTYGFNAGWWGYGVCISHSDLQGLIDGFGGIGATSVVLTKTSLAQVAGRVGYASAAIVAVLWFASLEDRGNGMCFAWPFWLPSAVPFMWPQ